MSPQPSWRRNRDCILFPSCGPYLTIRTCTQTNTMVQAFVVLMALCPRVQRKAQGELDAVIGPNRLPAFDDVASLPYLNALIKELLRWHSPVPCGLPHRTTSNEVYNGYFIPEGAFVFANIWYAGFICGLLTGVKCN